jgi:hypothetical protein
VLFWTVLRCAVWAAAGGEQVFHMQPVTQRTLIAAAYDPGKGDA